MKILAEELVKSCQRTDILPINAALPAPCPGAATSSQPTPTLYCEPRILMSTGLAGMPALLPGCASMCALPETRTVP